MPGKRPVLMIFARRNRFWPLLITVCAVTVAIILWWVMVDDGQQPVLPQHNSMIVAAPLFEFGENYFVNYRLEREKARQEAKNMLGVLLADPKNKEAETKWLALNDKMEKESEIENMLKIKGFKDGVVAVDSDSVSVVVYADSLTPGQVSMIQDIVLRVAKVRLDRISISLKT